MYVWHEVLLDWSYGIAFALASSPEEAKQAIINEGLDGWHWDGLLLDGQAPVEYDKPSGFYLLGGA